MDPRSFGEDPLRALRAVQMAARFELDVDPATAALCASMPLAELPAGRGTADGPVAPVRVLPNPDSPMPEVQLLSNGSYHVMVTQAGGGYSRWEDLAGTRWHEDPTCDAMGSLM